MAEDPYPEALALWRCIGCGAMGNAAECVGGCAFKREFVIEAERYADLLEHSLILGDLNDALRRLARDLYTETEAAERFGLALAGLRQRAKSLLALGAGSPPEPVEGDEIWRCAHCGLVEAFRDCLGVCIRRMGQFVSMADYEALACAVARLETDQRELAALARQIAWAIPKPGRADAMREAFRRIASPYVASGNRLAVSG